MSTASNVNIVGHPRVVGLTPANTSEATIFTSNDNNTTLVGIWVANASASTRTATVKWGDGSTDYPFINGYSMSGNTYLHEDMLIPMRDGYTIKVTSSAANDLTFTVVVVEGGSAFGARPSGR